MRFIYVAFAALIAASAPAGAQQQARSSYLVECLSGTCNFICYATNRPKGEALFQRRNVEKVEFLEQSGVSIATVRVAIEQPTVIRLGSTVFCEMKNGVVRPGK